MKRLSMRLLQMNMSGSIPMDGWNVFITGRRCGICKTALLLVGWDKRTVPKLAWNLIQKRWHRMVRLCSYSRAASLFVVLEVQTSFMSGRGTITSILPTIIRCVSIYHQCLIRQSSRLLMSMTLIMTNCLAGDFKLETKRILLSLRTTAPPLQSRGSRCSERGRI